MRAVVAILFGALLIWMQASAALAPAFVLEAGPCRCCDCGKPSCCIETAVPAPSPAPIAGQRPGAGTDTVLVSPAAIPATGLPDFHVSFRPFAPVWTPAIPLFQRDCALLI